MQRRNIMNVHHLISSSKTLAATALLALTGAAHAGGGVYWSVGVNAPIHPGHVNAVVSNGPVYYAPQPVVYYQPQPVVVRQPVYYQPQPVVYEEPPRARCWPQVAWVDRWHHHHHHRAEAYASGYGQGYEQGYERGYDRDDDRRGGWNRRDR
jgi:hypothetical protein